MGVPKALLRWNGKLLVDHGIDLLVTGGCEPVIVVLGAAVLEVRKQAGLAATVVVAADWAQGMGTSLATGLLAAAETDAEAAVIALVDQPFVGAEAIGRLIASGASAAVAEYDRKPLNPVLLAREHWADIGRSVNGKDEGARRWLSQHPELVTGVDCSDTGTAEDLDSPSDLRLLRR